MMKQFQIHLKYIGLGALLLTVALTGCKKLVEVNPPSNRVTGSSAYETDITAAAVMTGLYGDISGVTGGLVGLVSLSELCGLSADELDLYSTISDNQLMYYSNTLSAPTPPAIGTGHEFWSHFYTNIFTCNSAIEGVNNSKSLTAAVKQQILGEAKFMRALSYFYLVNLYGAAPLATSTDYTVNRQLTRSETTDVYKLIIDDLTEAQNLLSPNYLNPDLRTTTSNRVRPTKWAASALLARVYLYKGDYPQAETQASLVIGNSQLFSLLPLNRVFLVNSKEAIWQLQPVIADRNTQDGALFVLPSTGPSDINPVYLSSSLLNAFETGDQRKAGGNWIDSVKIGADVYYYPFKYKLGLNTTPGSESQMMFRLAEQYLIRAEARAQQNKVAESQSDLNAIRTRASLPNTTATDKNSLLAAIMQERRAELFTEMGHRWFDLKRTAAIDGVMKTVTPLKGGAAWQSFQQWYPLPGEDVLRDKNLSQNTGY